MFKLTVPLLLALALYGESRPPVIIVDGWDYCDVAQNLSTQDFGQLQQKLEANGFSVDYLAPCSVHVTTGTRKPTIEELGQALAGRIAANRASQVDLIAFGMGCHIARSYLSGKQNEPGVFNPPANHKIRKVVLIAGANYGATGWGIWWDNQTKEMEFASRFIWDLATWNQGGDDLRQIDAIAVVGNAGGADSDGFADLTSTSLLFAYPAERTRVIPACESLEYCSPLLEYIDSDSHPTWRIINSFLSGTDEWKTVGVPADHDPVLSAKSGVMVAVKDASDKVIGAGSVSLSGQPLGYNLAEGPGIFYLPSFPKGDYTLQASAPVTVPPVTFSSKAGTYSVMTMKPGPLISAVIPAGSATKKATVPAGSGVDIYGARLSTGGAKTAQSPFPTLLGDTAVTVNGRPIALSFAGESQVKAILPEDLSGYVQMTVKTSEGVHSMNLFIDAKTSLPPQVNSGGVVNNASYSSDASAPGEIAAVFGTNLTDGTSCLPPSCGPAFGSAGKLNTTMAGAEVTVNSVPVPIFYAAPGQLGIQIPFEVTGTSATVSVSVAGQASTPATITLAPVSPGIFTVTADGKGAGAITHVDGSAVTVQSPAHPGEMVILYATGLGQVAPAVPTGTLPGIASSTVAPVTLTVGGISVIPDFAGLAGCCVGLNQINARVPAGVSSGNAVPVVLNISGRSSNTATIAIQ